MPTQGQKGEQELSPSGEYWEQIPQSGAQKYKTKYQKHNTHNPIHTKKSIEDGGITVEFWAIKAHTFNWNSFWIIEDLGIIEFLWIINKTPKIS